MTAPALLPTAQNAMRIAKRALDRANEVHALVQDESRAREAFEARHAEAMGKIAAELGDIRSALQTIVEMLARERPVPA